MNAILTWWGVSVAIINHTPVGSALIGPTTMIKVVPVFVAVMVWLIRVLIIGTFSIAGENLFSLAEDAHRARPNLSEAESKRPATPTYVRPLPKPLTAAPGSRQARVEPTYHPIGMNASATDRRGGLQA